MPTIFTIGHTTRTIDEFLAMLQQVAVDHLVDVRAVPKSRSSPQFNSENLRKALANGRIEYRHIALLGGLPPQRIGSSEVSGGFWRNVSFQNYAAYAETTVFQSAMIELRNLALDYCCAIMSEEALWRCCHRHIIADYLLVDGITVAHIVGLDNIEIATLTPGVHLLPDGRLRYPIVENSVVTED